MIFKDPACKWDTTKHCQSCQGKNHYEPRDLDDRQIKVLLHLRTMNDKYGSHKFYGDDRVDEVIAHSMFYKKDPLVTCIEIHDEGHYGDLRWSITDKGRKVLLEVIIQNLNNQQISMLSTLKLTDTDLGIIMIGSKTKDVLNSLKDIQEPLVQCQEVAHNGSQTLMWSITDKGREVLDKISKE